MTVYELAQALGGAVKTHTGFRARCPGHDDHHASLDISPGNKQPIILTCRVCGNSPEAQARIIDALKAQGLWPRGEAASKEAGAPAPSNVIPIEKAKDWQQIVPVPDDIPEPPLLMVGGSKPTARWAYRSADGKLLCYTERFDFKEKPKEILPLTWCASPTGAKAWRRKALPKPHPLYGLERLAQKPDAPVLITEGEKKADAGNRLLSSYVAVSWAGGVGRVSHADWTPLKGRAAVIWPDHDGVGLKAAHEIKEILDRQTPEHPTRILDVPENYPRGWDIADAEEERWQPAQVLAFVEAGSVPPDAGQEPPDSSDPGNRHFVCLGWDHLTYYFRSIRDPQVIPHSGSSLANKGTLLTLAPLSYWEARFVEKTGVNWTSATDDVIQRCKNKGIYNPGDVRGRGAWIEDDGRLVLHTGKKLYIDNVETSINEFQSSRYSYEAAWDFGLNLRRALDDLEGEKILKLCRSLRWRKPVSGDFLAGWIVLAPFSGALTWRPHIWLTGSAGTGKSTLVRDVVRKLVAIAEYFEGATTAAGVRQSLEKDARPVLFDEAERTGSTSDARLQDLIELIMVASSGEGKIAKGTTHQKAVAAIARSCFCLASINTALDRQGVARRITPLEMLPGDPEQWKIVSKQIEALPRGENLIARTMANFKALRRNIETFRIAVADHFNNQPMGDQFGPLLAGACSLVTAGEVTLDQARKFVEKRDWEEHQLVTEDKDENQAISRLLNHVIRMTRPAGAVERTVGELIQIAAVGKEGGDGITEGEAEQQLMRVGIAVSEDKGFVFVAQRSAELEKVFRNTQWERNWHDSLDRLRGATRNVRAKFASGRLQRSIQIPLPSLFGSDSEAVA